MSVRVFKDMLGREVQVNYPPQRIISLVPSQTELLYDLGLDEEVAGITKFCVHPEKWFRNKKRVGGTKNINIAAVQALQPDLIIANKEENTKEQIEALAAMYTVWVSNIQTMEDALQMIGAVGELTAKSETASSLVQEINSGFATLQKTASPVRVAYFIWRNPWMCAGGDTFINEMIKKMGWENVLADKMRYPEIQLEELKDRGVVKILLSSEPYPFKAAHKAEIQSVLPDAEVLLVDGEMFSWYGSRLREAAGYLQGLI
jgi:ABC-type Fe3+-hydroxamate transport system substrate-binding protein